MIKTKRKNNSHHKIEQNTKKTIVELTLFQRDEIKIRIKYEVSGVNTTLDRAYIYKITKTKR